MTAVTTRMVRSGGYLVEDSVTGELIVEDTHRPATYGHVIRDGLRVRWEITEGKHGRRLAAGRTWTKGGAWVAAITAAHRRPVGWFCAVCAVGEGTPHEMWCERAKRGAS